MEGASALLDDSALARNASIQHLVIKLAGGGAGEEAGSGQRLVRAGTKVLTQAKADAQSAARSLNQAIKKLATTKQRAEAKLVQLAADPKTALPQVRE